MFKALSLLPIAAFAANWQAGSCPDYKSDVEKFSPESMTGLWFEYVWTEGFMEGDEYRCSSWTILNNGGFDQPQLVYNQQIPGITNEEGETGKFF